MLSNQQRILLIALVVIMPIGLITDPVVTLLALNAVLTVFFAAANLMKVELLRRAARARRSQVIDLRQQKRSLRRAAAEARSCCPSTMKVRSSNNWSKGHIGVGLSNARSST